MGIDSLTKETDQGYTGNNWPLQKKKQTAQQKEGVI